jgi:hypothetical protein
MGVPQSAVVVRDPNGFKLLFTATNHRGGICNLGVEINFDGEPRIGDAEVHSRFVFYRLGPGVWKLAPSIDHDTLHAYITVVGVPEPSPWMSS